LWGAAHLCSGSDGSKRDLYSDRFFCSLWASCAIGIYARPCWVSRRGSSLATVPPCTRVVRALGQRRITRRAWPVHPDDSNGNAVDSSAFELQVSPALSRLAGLARPASKPSPRGSSKEAFHSSAMGRRAFTRRAIENAVIARCNTIPSQIAGFSIVPADPNLQVTSPSRRGSEPPRDRRRGGVSTGLMGSFGHFMRDSQTRSSRAGGRRSGWRSPSSQALFCAHSFRGPEFFSFVVSISVKDRLEEGRAWVP